MKSRQLPKHTSPQRGLPMLTRQIPSSIESAASTFSSLFGRRNKNQEQQQQPPPDIHPIMPMQTDAYMNEGYVEFNQVGGAYNENYNYAYRSMDSADELMPDDGDNNNLINGRLGAALPTLPYNNYTSEPGNHAIPSIDVQYDQNAYYGDEYYDSSMYKSGLTPSPKRSKVCWILF
jgi:hypothetical protein